jgi:hypothetical protein
MAEDELNTQIRGRLLEVDETLTILAGATTVALPDRYIEPVFLEIVFNDDRENERLTYLSPDQMTVFSSPTARQEPEYWTINGGNIEFPEPADLQYQLRFRMLKRLNLFEDLTNEVITNYRGLYLYGSLLQAAPYIIGDERIPTWTRMYENLLKKVRDKESRVNVRANLRTEIDYHVRRSDIFRG